MVQGIRIFGNMTLLPDSWFGELELYIKDVLEIIEENGMTVTGHCSKEFSPGAFTLNVMLSESHLCIHTWPEEKFYSLDVHTCNYTKDNDENAKRMFNEIGILFGTDFDKSQVTTIKS